MMSAISITKLYDLLTAKVGKETAESLTSYIEEKVKDEVDYKSQMMATKEDIAGVKLEIVEVKDEISKLHTKIADSKAELIKWMFIFWIGQVAVTFGFILLFLKK